ncbi:MAG: EamA family transporter [Alphaproteobacteria bacterium]|nr:EamA family transporter [Alphaproteobacteria bacterium]HCP01828.1 EamA family transporter [Rhodospirillaceae bacterium]
MTIQTPPPPKPPASLLVAVGWMTGTLLSFTFMAIAVRELSGEIHSFQTMLFRSIGALMILLPFVLIMGREVWHTRNLKLQFGRNTVHFAAQLGWITGIGLLPLAEVFAIEFTAPIWATIMAILFLGERLNRGRVVAVLFGFLGILVILRPGLAVIDHGAFAVLAAAVGFAMTLTITKYMTRNDAPITILLYMTVIQLPMGIGLSVFVWVTPDWLQLFWLFVVGATGLSAHYCTANALLVADQTIVVPIDFMRLPLIVAVGFLLYSEAVQLPVLIGAVMIFVGNYYSIRLEQRRRKTT